MLLLLLLLLWMNGVADNTDFNVSQGLMDRKLGVRIGRFNLGF